MPKQKIKKELKWSQGDQNLWIYGGWFDITNCHEDWDTILTLTKLYSLFYERIIVFDGFFSCYGPLFTALQKAEKHSKGNRISGWTEEDFKKHEILELLFEGIIIPAHREEDSMSHTFINGNRGMIPGEYFCVQKNEGEPILDMVDEISQFYFHQPDQNLGPSSTAFHDALWNSLLHQDTSIGQAIHSPYLIETTDNIERDTAMRIRRILDDFQFELHESKGNKAFRRGWVEQWSAKKLGIDLKSYSSFLNKVNFSYPFSTAEESLILSILHSAATAYELMHAKAFKCQAGLFSLHDRDILKLDIIRKIATATTGNGPKMKQSFQVGSMLTLKNLSVQNIVEFRARDEFRRYCEEIKDLKIPSEGESLFDANPRFKYFFLRQYLPKLIEFFQSISESNYKTNLSTIGSTIGGLGGAYALYTSAFDFEGLELFGISVNYMLRGLSCIAGAVGVASYVNPITKMFEKIKTVRCVRRFCQNNYSLINE